MKITFHFLRLLTLWCGLFVGVSAAANRIESVRLWPSPENTRIVFDMQQKPAFNLQSRQGQQVVLEISDVASASLGKMSGESDLVREIRVQKDVKSQRVKVLIDLSRPTKEKAFYLPPSDRYGHRLVLDLAEESNLSSPKVVTVTRSTTGERDVIIAIDAGHGGHDPGAIGPKGTYEKHITMAVSQRLQALINKEPGFKAVMVRTSDYYIFPSKRPDVARDKQADLLVSIHADAAENRKASGASVWVLSLRRATTEVGRMMEQTEQHSELLGGVAEVIKDSANERYLAQTVLDLSMNHSMTTGFEVAKLVLSELDKVTKLHKSAPMAASLGVLKAPDIPSILVETGYISNFAEEQKLKTSSHQQKLANAIFKALKRHFLDNPPSDAWLAQRKSPRSKGNSIESITSRQEGSSTASAANRSNSALALPSTSVPASKLPSLSQPSSVDKSSSRDKTSSAKTEGRAARVHKVKSGESLSMLARQYGVPMSVLRSHNRLKTDNIQIGQVLRIPAQ